MASADERAVAGDRAGACQPRLIVSKGQEVRKDSLMVTQDGFADKLLTLVHRIALWGLRVTPPFRKVIIPLAQVHDIVATRRRA